MRQDDAVRRLLQWIREGRPSQYAKYGYDIYLPNVVRWHVGSTDPQVQDQGLKDLIPAFCDAAWALVRRGILRPGIREYGAQATDEGSAGLGFSITPFGRQWIAESEHEDFVPTEPERFGELLAENAELFGAGFHQRAQEAIRCYGAHAYLACCAMCGAAAESILLATAIAKTGDQQKVLDEYQSKGGRGRIEKRIAGQAPAPLQQEFKSQLTLLKYWRDASAHGEAVQIAEGEAFTSLAMLLRLAMLASDNWETLAKP